MRVLLLGDYSSFHKNLQKGLQAVGVDCKIASDGDGWKKLSGYDFGLWENTHKGFWGRKYDYNIKPLLDLDRFYNYDIVQFVHPCLFSVWINELMMKQIIRHNGKSFVSVCGDANSVYQSYVDGKLGTYYVYDDNPAITDKYHSRNLRDHLCVKQENFVYNHVDGIIPVMYEYAQGVRNRPNCLPTIPLPFDCRDIRYEKNIVKEKIVIMHGIIKEKSKGSDYIIKALDIIKERHPKEVEIIIDGKMPLKDYLNLLRRTNILIDQCKEHCWGMNACYGMAMGKIVLGGASDNSLKELGLTHTPVVHIEPNVEYIVSQLEQLIENSNKFESLGEEARQFVETFHDCKKIAINYIDAWEKA